MIGIMGLVEIDGQVGIMRSQYKIPALWGIAFRTAEAAAFGRQLDTHQPWINQP